jgi:hypothetical protein
MPKHQEPVKPATEIALKAEARLRKVLVRIGNDEVHYLRCFRTGNGKQLALNRVLQSLYVWTEPVWERAAPAFQAMRKKRYPPAKSRISTLKSNAPRLWSSPADYWRFPTLADLEAFVDWYKTL